MRVWALVSCGGTLALTTYLAIQYDNAARENAFVMPTPQQADDRDTDEIPSEVDHLTPVAPPETLKTSTPFTSPPKSAITATDALIAQSARSRPSPTIASARAQLPNANAVAALPVGPSGPPVSVTPVPSQLPPIGSAPSVIAAGRALPATASVALASSAAAPTAVPTTPIASSASPVAVPTNPALPAAPVAVPDGAARVANDISDASVDDRAATPPSRDASREQSRPNQASFAPLPVPASVDNPALENEMVVASVAAPSPLASRPQFASDAAASLPHNQALSPEGYRLQPDSNSRKSLVKSLTPQAEELAPQAYSVHQNQVVLN